MGTINALVPTNFQAGGDMSPLSHTVPTLLIPGVNYLSQLNVMRWNVLFSVFRDVKQGNVNLLVVDWSCSAGTQSCQLITDYCTTVEQIEGIAQEVGSFLAWMHSNLGLNGSETNFYGHSLGAHVLGGAGRQFRSLLGTNISLIVGEAISKSSTYIFAVFTISVTQTTRKFLDNFF